MLSPPNNGFQRAAPQAARQSERGINLLEVSLPSSRAYAYGNPQMTPRTTWALIDGIRIMSWVKTNVAILRLMILHS